MFGKIEYFSYIVYIKQNLYSMNSNREMHKTLTVEQQLQKIDQYIDWLNADWENHKKMQKYNFMYQNEYVDSLKRRKWLITEGHGLDNWDRQFLNQFEKLVNSK